MHKADPHTRSLVIWAGPNVAPGATVTVTQLVILQLLPNESPFSPRLEFGFFFKYPDYKLQRPGKPGQPQTEVSSSGFGNCLCD